MNELHPIQSDESSRANKLMLSIIDEIDDLNEALLKKSGVLSA
jgi:hypothetical protein